MEYPLGAKLECNWRMQAHQSQGRYAVGSITRSLRHPRFNAGSQKRQDTAQVEVFFHALFPFQFTDPIRASNLSKANSQKFFCFCYLLALYLKHNPGILFNSRCRQHLQAIATESICDKQLPQLAEKSATCKGIFIWKAMLIKGL